MADVVAHKSVETTRKYLAKSRITSKIVAEAIFGPSDCTRLLDPRNQEREMVVVEEFPEKLASTYLNSKVSVIYRCILAGMW